MKKDKIYLKKIVIFTIFFIFGYISMQLSSNTLSSSTHADLTSINESLEVDSWTVFVDKTTGKFLFIVDATCIIKKEKSNYTCTIISKTNEKRVFSLTDKPIFNSTLER